MTAQPDQRVLGLSRKARRLVFPMLGLALVVILVGSVMTRGDGAVAGSVVGGDLHAVSELDDRLFVGGHAGAGSFENSGAWTQIATLDDKDVMGWAQTDDALLAGGHGGLYRSTDDGSAFAAVGGLPVSDVHALGASGERVYVGSPEVGVMVSDDGGRSFVAVSDAGRDFMGTIWVDPTNPDVAVAPSMQSGAVKTLDGGATWTSLGSSSGSMAIAVDPSGLRIAAIGMDGAELSEDAGATWVSLDVPRGTSAITYTADGDLVVAALAGDRAQVYTSVGGRWKLLA